MSQQFNFSLHVKVNHIEFEEKFFDKIHENVKDLLSVDLCKNFLRNKGRNEH